MSHVREPVESEAPDGGVAIDDAWLSPTWYIDSEHSSVVTFAAEATAHAETPMEKAISLFMAVRDGFRYDPYDSDPSPEAYRASSVVASTSNWCVPKSVLLTAAARTSGIPARLGFADVRNHLTSEKLTEEMGTDLFIWHGFSELLVDDRWFKLSTAFNIELCQKFGVKVLEFDGTDDALMHPFDESGNRHMEYTRYRGSFDDLPLDQITTDFAVLYPNWSESNGSSDDAFDA